MKQKNITSKTNKHAIGMFVLQIIIVYNAHVLSASAKLTKTTQ